MQTRPVLAAGAALAILFLGTHLCLAQIPIINLPHDARSYALAGGGVADGSNPSTILNNPAVAARLNGAYLSAYSGEILPDLVNDVNLKGGVLSGGYPVYEGDVVLRLGGEVRFAKLNYGAIEITDTQGMPLGYFDSYEEYYSFTAAVDLQFAHSFHLGIGSTYKSLSTEYFLTGPAAPVDGDGSVYDVGFLLAYSASNPADWSVTPALGISLRSFGSDLEYGSYGTIEPGRHNAYGVSIDIQSPYTTLLDASVPTFAMVFNFDLEKSEDPDKLYSAGLELGFWQVIFARLGFEAIQNVDPKALTLGLGAGLPLREFMFRFDYAMVPLTIIDGNHGDRANKFTLSLGWTPQQAVHSN